jgi:hypothetical protein
MNSPKIEKILERYFEGETSLSEERKLREFFQQEEVPDHLADLREQFLLYDQELKESLPPDFDRQLFDEISMQERNRKASRRAYIYYVSGVAATILIMITLFIRFDPFTARQQYTEQDAEIAFNEASRILYFVSDRFNTGTNPLGKVARFEEGVEDLKTVKKFDEGVDKTTSVAKFNMITKMFTNPAP